MASASEACSAESADVAASEANKKAPRCFTKEQDGLAQDWTGLICWMNPEYNQAKAWCKKASEAKALVVALLPARTDTAWFHDYVMTRAKEVRFMRGRPKFLIDGKPVLNDKGQPSAGKFPAMVVVWDGRPVGKLEEDHA